MERGHRNILAQTTLTAINMLPLSHLLVCEGACDTTLKHRLLTHVIEDRYQKPLDEGVLSDEAARAHACTDRSFPETH